MLNTIWQDKLAARKVRFGPFAGAKLYCKLRNSKRKLLGLYEHVLNDWIAQHIQEKQFVFDVGANTGFHTYGFAHLLSQSGVTNPTVFAFEPRLGEIPELSIPLGWEEYREVKIKLIDKCISNDNDKNSMTLDWAYQSFSEILTGAGLIKIDVEGAELEALQGARQLLDCTSVDWLIEIHGKHLIAPVSEFFVKRQRPFLIKELAPVFLLGLENRLIDTYWLVTI